MSKDSLTTANKTVAVFCSARDIGKKYKDIARESGKLIGELGLNFIYGGGQQGLMGVSSRAAKKAGSFVRGISTHLLLGKEAKIEDGDTNFFVKDMGERKQIQLEIADYVLILAGGFGTMDEIFETLTFNQLNISSNKLIVYDDEIEPILKDLCEVLIKRGTIYRSDAERINYVHNLEELEYALRN